jgi:hypothetical protein
VIIRFPTAALTIVDSTGASSAVDGSDTVLTWNASGTFEFTLAAGATSFPVHSAARRAIRPLIGR